MKSFLEEYGFAILAAIVVILLIAMCTPVGGMIKTQVLDIVEKFSKTTDKKVALTEQNQQVMLIQQPTGRLVGYVIKNSTTDQFEYYISYRSGGNLIKDEKHDAEIKEGSNVFNVITKNPIDAGSQVMLTIKNVGTGEETMANPLVNPEMTPGYINSETDENDLFYANIKLKSLGFEIGGYSDDATTFNITNRLSSSSEQDLTVPSSITIRQYIDTVANASGEFYKIVDEYTTYNEQYDGQVLLYKEFSVNGKILSLDTSVAEAYNDLGISRDETLTIIERISYGTGNGLTIIPKNE